MFVLKSPGAPITVGTAVCVHLCYVHEGPALPAGAALRLGFSHNDGAHMLYPHDPQATVRIRGNATVHQFLRRWRRSITFFPGTGVSDLAIVDLETTAALNAGDQLDIFLGQLADGTPCFVPGIACGSPLEFFYHLDPDGRFPLVSLHPNAPAYEQYIAPDGSTFPDWRSCGVAIDLRPDAPRTVDLSLPSRIRVGEPQELRLVVYDRFHNHIANYRGQIAPRTDLASLGIVAGPLTFDTGATGSARIPLTCNQPGLLSGLAFAVGDLGVWEANPVRVTAASLPGVYWGDLHGHSALSDGGVRGPESFFAYARDVRGLDFAALADHAFGLAVGNHWDRLLDALREYSADPDFVPILGYEIMTNGHGHRNVYFAGLEGTLAMADYQPGSGGSFAGENIPAYAAIWNPDVPKTPTLADFFAALDDQEVLHTAHHCGDVTVEERPRLTLYEACSEWGISEEDFRRNTSTTTLAEIFAQRLSPGLTGGSDDHHARAGFLSAGFQSGPVRWPSGLTAVYCPAVNRRAVYGALTARHCYATTGARILLEPRVARHHTALSLRLFVCGTARLERLWVFKNGRQAFHQYCGPSPEWHLDWQDVDSQPDDVYYVRVTQIDGHAAWINPLPFADHPATGSDV